MTTMREGIGAVRIDEAADLLHDAEHRVEAIGPLTERFDGMTLEDAYAIQLRNVKRRVGMGARVVGRKVGLTSAVMQAQLSVSEPDFGHLLDDMMLDDGTTLELSQFLAARVEPETAFVLGRRIAGPGVRIEQVLAAIVAVVPCFEVIDSRIADWQITLHDTVADNGSAARVVLGAPVDPRSCDLDQAEVTVAVDEVDVATGRGEAVLGHPAAAVAWLANALVAFDAGLEAGDTVLPGSMTAAVTLQPGTTVTADFGPLGTVGMSVAAKP